MDHYNFKISIDAPRATVWDVLWGTHTYPQWTSFFGPGSVAETDWRTGSKVLFIDDERSGMIATIAENKPHEHMSIRLDGQIIKGVEDFDSPDAKSFAGAYERYTLRDINGTTELSVDLDGAEKFGDMFAPIWPKALQKVKDLSEGK